MAVITACSSTKGSVSFLESLLSQALNMLFKLQQQILLKSTPGALETFNAEPVHMVVTCTVAKIQSSDPVNYDCWQLYLMLNVNYLDLCLLLMHH